MIKQFPRGISENVTSLSTAMLFNNETMSFCLMEIWKMTTKSKKEKADGREKHRQMLRDKKMKKQEKKNISLPTRHKK